MKMLSKHFCIWLLLNIIMLIEKYSALIKPICNAYMQVAIDEDIQTPKNPIKIRMRQRDTFFSNQDNAVGLFPIALHHIAKRKKT